MTLCRTGTLRTNKTAQSSYFEECTFSARYARRRHAPRISCSTKSFPDEPHAGSCSEMNWPSRIVTDKKLQFDSVFRKLLDSQRTSLICRRTAMSRMQDFAVSAILSSTVFALMGFAGSEGFGQTIRSRTQNFILSRPTVSPYLNLVREGSGLTANYQTLVRPAMERRRQANRQQVAISRLQSSVTNMQGEMASRRQPQGRFSTGHPSGFMYYSHYYPALSRRRR